MGDFPVRTTLSIRCSRIEALILQRTNPGPFTTQLPNTELLSEMAATTACAISCVDFTPERSFPDTYSFIKVVLQLESREKQN